MSIKSYVAYMFQKGVKTFIGMPINGWNFNRFMPRLSIHLWNRLKIPTKIKMLLLFMMSMGV